ncbi:MAG: hypothetical protein ABIJ28_01010 [Patescibacteria group bacterium]
MKIEFTKEQYEKLIKLVYLGNWMANANRTDDRLKDYEDLEEYILSFAKDFGFDKYVDDEEMNGRKFFPTRYLEEETDIRGIIEEYDEDAFWDEIIDRLGERDFYRKYSKEEIEKMSHDERFEKLCECIDEYSEETSNYGIERLEIKEDK